jgi:hypothetical protein
LLSVRPNARIGKGDPFQTKATSASDSIPYRAKIEFSIRSPPPMDVQMSFQQLAEASPAFLIAPSPTNIEQRTASVVPISQ